MEGKIIVIKGKAFFLAIENTQRSARVHDSPLMQECPGVLLLHNLWPLKLTCCLLKRPRALLCLSFVSSGNKFYDVF